MLPVMELALNLKKILSVRHLSLTKLSKQTGVPVTTISNWLNGQPPRNISQVKAIATFLSLTVDELVFGANEATRVRTFLDEFSEKEHHAGVYEVILRKISK